MRLLFGRRASVHPPLQELGVVLHEVHGDRQPRSAAHREVRPCLPVVQRPRRKKQQRGHDEMHTQQPAERSFIQTAHGSILALAQSEFPLECGGSPPLFLPTTKASLNFFEIKSQRTYKLSPLIDKRAVARSSTSESDERISM